MKRTILIGFAALFLGCAVPEKKKLDNSFYVFNNCIRTLPDPPKTMKAQALLIKEIGFDGMGGHIGEDYFERRAALDETGLRMPDIYWGLTLADDAEVVYNKAIKDIIKDSKGRDLLVTLFINAKKRYRENNEEGDPLIAEKIGELADFAAQYGVRVAVYPHVNSYCETVAHAVRLARIAGRKNAGVVFNVCHLLKVEGEENWQEKALMALPHLFMVSINGADSGNTKAMGWDRLIRPLGEGTFDTYALVKFFKDNDYEGMFGLQCYRINQNCETALKKSMKAWRSYQERYASD